MTNQEIRELGGMPVGLTSRDPITAEPVWHGILRVRLSVSGGPGNETWSWVGQSCYTLHPEKPALAKDRSPFYVWDTRTAQADARVYLRIYSVGDAVGTEHAVMDVWGWDDDGNEWIAYRGVPMHAELVAEIERCANEIAKERMMQDSPVVDLEF